jgi:CubicO group peptidase (beta-lactamase class C family)
MLPMLVAALLTLLLSCSVDARGSGRERRAPTATAISKKEANEIDRLIARAMATWHVPGAALAIVRNDAVVYLKGYGIRDITTREPVTPDTIFAIGSVTKAFTATAMAMLVDEGKMNWDDPVRKHIEFFHLSDPLADANVTLRDLVNHRTGVTDHFLLWYGSPWGREELIRRIGRVKLAHPFRAEWDYQNIMYLAAGYAVGRAAGSTWEEFVQKRIFDPLGMTGASFSTTVAATAPNHASPHGVNERGQPEVIPWRNLDNIAPAGAINASVRDMSRWLRFQLDDGTFDGKRLVSRANLEETHTPQMIMRLAESEKAMFPQVTQMSYGMGWVVLSYADQLLLLHPGGIDGFSARVVLVPRARLGFVLLDNSGSQMPTAVGYHLVDLLLGLPRTDWIKVYRELEKKPPAEPEPKATQQPAPPQEDQQPSRELAAYAATYEEPAYGSLRVSLENGGLTLQWSSFTTRLEHQRFETFVTRDRNPIQNQQVVFRLDSEGEVTALSFLGQEFRRSSVKPVR